MVGMSVHEHDTFGRLRALIGGSPSSGSTLLSVLLDRHPEIMCGPELNLFAHPALWHDGPSDLVRRINDQKMDAPGIVPWARPSNSSLEYYLMPRAELSPTADEISDPLEFASHVLDARGSVEHTTIYLEKSPPNVFAMDAALHRFRDMKAIVTIRDGTDVLYSLARRNNPLPVAAARWVVKVNLVRHLIERYGSERVHLLRYEDLVTSPETSLTGVLRFIGAEQIDLTTSTPSSRAQADASLKKEGRNAASSWQMSPLDKIDPGGIGGGEKHLSNAQLHYLLRLRPRPNVLAEFGFSGSYYSGAELEAYFGYGTRRTWPFGGRLRESDANVATNDLSRFYLPLVDDGVQLQKSSSVKPKAGRKPTVLEKIVREVKRPFRRR